METFNRPFEAYLDKLNCITILVPLSHNFGICERFTISVEEEDWELRILNVSELELYKKYSCQIQSPLQIGNVYIITDDHGCQSDLQIGAVIRTEEFDDIYCYEGNDLGACYTREQCSFKLWAPTATNVRLVIKRDEARVEKHEMQREEKGVWSISLSENMETLLYRYEICVNRIWRTAVDPYARAVTIDGEYGIIVDLKKTKKAPICLPKLAEATDAVIYETNIRDFSIHPKSGIREKGKYIGLTELNTSGNGGASTCLSYLLELGITHVELLPFNDFGGVNKLNPSEKYNWGYNPLHFNVPEGSYCSNPHDPYNRIIELKTAIHTLQQNGLRVIMDVVYNHVYIREESSFEKIVPGYYFRHDEHGMPSNGTGVGNDIASERKMVRKFIIDSILFWLTEYHVNGFRFDLMGILDVDTMNQIRREVDRIDCSVILLGEGWDLNTPLSADKKATIRNASLLPRIAQFNDLFRDSIKGSTFNLYDRGYALGNIHKENEVKKSIVGGISLLKGEKGLFVEPVQSINYVESHDNHTLWDKMMVCNGHESEDIRKKRQLLATTIVLLSQGIPFLHSGQEFFRTKQGVENSYNSPDEINQLDWTRKACYEKEVSFIKGIIAIRRQHKAFRFGSAILIRRHLRFHHCSEGIVMFSLSDVSDFGPWKNIVVIFGNQQRKMNLPIPLENEWHVICDGMVAGTTPLYTRHEKIIQSPEIGTIVIVQ